MCTLVAALNPTDLDALDESVPFTKKTLDNLLGRELSVEEYQRYWQLCAARRVPLIPHGAQLLIISRQAAVSAFTRTCVCADTHARTGTFTRAPTPSPLRASICCRIGAGSHAAIAQHAIVSLRFPANRNTLQPSAKGRQWQPLYQEFARTDIEACQIPAVQQYQRQMLMKSGHGKTKTCECNIS